MGSLIAVYHACPILTSLSCLIPQFGYSCSHPECRLPRQYSGQKYVLDIYSIFASVDDGIQGHIGRAVEGTTSCGSEADVIDVGVKARASDVRPVTSRNVAALIKC